MIPVFKYVITERNSEIGYQFAAAVLRESGKQNRYHADMYVYNSLGYAYTVVNVKLMFVEIDMLSFSTNINLYFGIKLPSSRHLDAEI